MRYTGGVSNAFVQSMAHNFDQALRLMEDARHRHLPIVEDEKVVGVVSRFDFKGLELDRLDEETGLWERI